MKELTTVIFPILIFFCIVSLTVFGCLWIQEQLSKRRGIKLAKLFKDRIKAEDTFQYNGVDVILKYFHYDIISEVYEIRFIYNNKTYFESWSRNSCSKSLYDKIRPK